jgi:hypothetical protein
MYLDGWMDGWMGGWMEVKAVLRIAFSNQKNIIFSDPGKTFFESDGYGLSCLEN